MSKEQELYQLWVNNVTDKELMRELKEIEGDFDAIQDRFYRDLEFGTAGLRGVIGAGTNRMNVYTVARATQGFADYINSVTNNGSVAIAYDSRINSDLFSKTAACVFAANGIKVYLYPELAPTPMLSFAVRYKKCDCGVVITASHNPSKYNGYKAYGSDGCQLTEEASALIMKNTEKTDMFTGVKTVDYDSAVAAGTIELLTDEVFEEYYKCVMAQQINPGVIKNSDLKVIYTPLHGAGNRPVRAVLARVGVENLTVVKEQEEPDGNFPTAPYPNPEIRQPFECALALAKEVQPDLLLATDPDSDRVGIAVRDGGEYKLLTGNEVGAMLLYYVLSQRKENGTLPANPVAVKSIVTTALCDKIAAQFGCEMRSVLTGFKYIGEQIAKLENANQVERYVFGFEESYGYLAGSYVRDKDAVVASMLICEMAAFYKTQGVSLIDQLRFIYDKYGYYRHKTLSFSFEGISGAQKMKDIMDGLRTDAPTEIAGRKVLSTDDYLLSATTDASGAKTAIDLPKSNVVNFDLDGDAKVIFRPSGTEPKVKVYLTVKGGSESDAAAQIGDLETLVKKQFGL